MSLGMKIPNVLSIAGSDPSGGAGVQADLKTFAALECYGMAVITALTAQNTQGVSGVMEVPADFVKMQIKDVFDDVRVDAVKIGMLSSAEIIMAVAEMLERYKPTFVVLDPVMISTSGDALISAGAVEAMKERLIPLCDVLTPNIPEAEKLSRKAVLDLERSAQDLLALGAPSVYLKGGHLKGDKSVDVLATAQGCHFFESMRIETKNTHGTGCSLSSALAAYVARGFALQQACQCAKEYITGAIIHADELDVGKGCGPVHHTYRMTGGDRLNG